MTRLATLIVMMAMTACAIGDQSAFDLTKYGSDPAQVNATPVIQGLIDCLPETGGRVLLPPGDFTVDTLFLPPYPKSVEIIGSGIRATVLTARCANAPIFASSGVVIPGYATAEHVVTDIGVRPNIGGSTGPAIDMRNMSWTKFDRIAFLPNGTGKWTHGFYLYASDTAPYSHCYNNIMRDVFQRCDTSISGSVVRFEGTANHHLVERIVAVGVTTKCGVSLANGYMQHIRIRDCHFEGITSDPACIDVGNGNHSLYVDGCYFENVAKAFSENRNSGCFISDTFFAQSPGSTQPCPLPPNYCFRNCPSGGDYTSNSQTGLLSLYSMRGLRIFDHTNGGWITVTFDGIRLSSNYPIASPQFVVAP